MAAHGDDQRHHYSETIGDSIVVAVTNSSTALGAPLVPGRYMLHIQDVVTAVKLWVRQGPHESMPDAAVAAPATPIDLTEDPRMKLTFMVRPPGQGIGATKATDGLRFITNAGTATAVITRISNG